MYQIYIWKWNTPATFGVQLLNKDHISERQNTKGSCAIYNLANILITYTTNTRLISQDSAIKDWPIKKSLEANAKKKKFKNLFYVINTQFFDC